MPNVLLIAACLCLVVHDMIGEPVFYGSLGAPLASGITLVALLAPVLRGRRSFKRLLARGASRGELGTIARAERRLRSAQRLLCVVFIVCVLAVGWLDAVRTLVGDLVLADELLALVPLLVLRWWTHTAQHRVERLVYGAGILGRIDRGDPVYALPGPASFAAGLIRQELALSVIPVLLLLGWAELLDRVLAARGLASNAWLTESLRLFGALAILVLTPPFLSRVLGTIRLGAGELRSRLEAVAERASVGLADIRVWRTRGAISNAAITGFVSPLRIVLITDGLLDRLTARQLEGVMAHEVGHARLWHLPWLLVALVGPVLLTASVASAGIAWIAEHSERWRSAAELWGEGGVAALSIIIAALMFGVVSRRFERQADVFAAQNLSGDGPISEEAAGSMCSALLAVTAANHGDPERFSFRHGTITGRIRSLHESVGSARPETEPDLRANGARWLAAVTLALGLASAILLH